MSTTVLSASTLTNFTVAGSSDPQIELSGNGILTSTRTIASGLTGAVESNSLNVKVSAGADTITMNASHVVKNLEFTSAFTGTWSNSTRTIYGNLILSPSMTLGSGSGTTTFAATSGTKTITSNGETMDFPVVFNGVGGTWQLQDALTLGNRTLTLTAGTFDASSYNVTTANFSSSGTGVRQIKFGSGTWTITGSGAGTWNCGTTTNMTTTQGTAVISFTSASTKNASFGGLTYPTINNGGAGALKVGDSNSTFLNLTNTVQPTTFTFDSGTTNYFTNFPISGTAGNLVTLGASGTGTHTLSKASGTVSVSYCSISDSNATGGATWLASVTNGNVDGGNNTGWNFAAIVAAGAYIGFFAFFN